MEPRAIPPRTDVPVSAEIPHVVVVSLDLATVGGAEIAAGEVMRRLAGRVHFTVFSDTIDPSLEEFVDWRRVPVPRGPFALRLAVFFVRCGWALRSIEADVRHAYGAFAPNRWDLVTLQFSHRSYVRRSRRLSPPGTHGLKRAVRATGRALGVLAELWCLRPARTRAIAAVSEGQRTELERVFPGIEIAITPNGCDTGRFAPDSSARARVRSAEAVPADAFVVLFCGTDWERKGLDVAIEGLARLRARASADVRLWVVGRGDEARFTAVAKLRGVADQVRFFGYHSDVAAFCQASDAFVLPTLYETFCIAAYEAAASGLPVIGTDVDGVRELIGDDEAGILIGRDPDAVAEALLQLIGDPDRCELWGRSAAGGRCRGTGTLQRCRYSTSTAGWRSDERPHPQTPARARRTWRAACIAARICLG